MWRAIASNAFTMLIVGMFLFGGVILWGQAQYRAEGPLAEAMCLRVAPGSNMRRVSATLEDRGAIESASIFRIGADYTDKSTQLKAGAFLVPEGASMVEIVDIVTRGGASTCGTEVVYRIGVTRSGVQVREMDPATNRFAEVASFNNYFLLFRRKSDRVFMASLRNEVLHFFLQDVKLTSTSEIAASAPFNL